MIFQSRQRINPSGTIYFAYFVKQGGGTHSYPRTSRGVSCVLLLMNTIAPSSAGYLPVVIFALIGFAFVGVNLFVARLLRPSAPNAKKLETYECGAPPVGEAWQQFNTH